MKPSVKPAAHLRVEWLHKMPWNECPPSRGIDAHLPWNAHGRRAIDFRGTDSLFVGSEAGAKAAAIAYTLIETAKLNGVDPNLWLADIIVHMARGKAIKVDDLLPWRWNR
jgi:hypothetical protein